MNKELLTYLYLCELQRCQRMAVWDHQGRVYVPVRDKRGVTYRYGTYKEAIAVLVENLDA